MQRSGFFDANLVGEEYDRVYLAAQFAAYFASFIGNGVYAKHSNQLQVGAKSNPSMAVEVASGQAWINGYWYENSDDVTLNVDVADGVLNRIDSIVLCLGFSERDMWLEVKKGTPATVPSAPSVIRSADYYEIQLATISIPASSIKITDSQITDMRANTNVCGWVTGVIDQIDTTTLFNQFQTYFEEFKANNEKEYEDWTEEQKNAYLTWIATQEGDFDDWYNSHTSSWQTQFNEWFAEIKEQLDEDVAGKLQNQINVLKDEFNGYSECITEFSEDGKQITQNLESGEQLVTKFIGDSEIEQEWFRDGAKVKRKTITFSSGGKVITEKKEEI